MSQLEMDWRAVERVGDAVSRDAAMRAGSVAAERARANIIAAGRVDTGAMRDSIEVREASESHSQRRSYWVGSDLPYTGYQEHGTSGAQAGPGKFLVFKPKGSSSVVFAKKVRGVTAANFLRDAVNSMSASDFVP